MNSSPEAGYDQGQRLTCDVCKAEIEIVNPCTCEPPDQEFRCCGQPMRASVGRGVHLNVES